MADVVSRVTVSLTDGTIQIEGGETFVREQLALFVDLIKDRLSATPKIKGNIESTDSSGHDKKRTVSDLAEYENVFAVADEKVQVLKDIPGNSKAEKTVNAALLLTFANEALGADQTTFDTIRELCQLHSCLDAPNFAGTIQDEKESFIVSGTRRKKAAKLTKPGQKRAKALADSLNVAT